jgi:hypothetical protein
MTEPISPLARKLGIKPGHHVLVVGAPDGIVELLDPLPAGATLGVPTGRTIADCVLIFAHDVAALPASFEAAGLFWVAYPKGGKKAGTDLNRDILRTHMSTHGLASVTLVAVNDVWSAMRFRPADQVGT